MKYFILLFMIFPLYTFAQDKSVKSFEIIDNGVTLIYEQLKRKDVDEIISHYDSLISNLKEKYQGFKCYFVVTENEEEYDSTVKKSVCRLINKLEKREDIFIEIKFEVVPTVEWVKTKYVLVPGIDEYTPPDNLEKGKNN